MRDVWESWGWPPASAQPAGAPDVEQLPAAAAIVAPPKADCCVAAAQFRVTWSRAVAGSDSGCELFLCGHHFSASRTALARLDAQSAPCR